MAGSILISKTSARDLRTVDFQWLADELRAKKGPAEAALARVLWPLDQAGTDILQADELDEGEFKLFAQAVREVHEEAAAARPNSGLTIFLQALLRDIESDRRSL